MKTLCRYLEWDSQFFGRRIARLEEPRLDTQLYSQARRWCQANAIDCLYFLCNSGDIDTIRVAQENDFRLVDIRMTLQCRPAATPGRDASPRPEDAEEQVRIGPSATSDTDALRALARSSHRDTRFYRDGHFPRAKCDALYEEWIDKSCRGAADAVFVARRCEAHEAHEAVAGYISCHLPKADGGVPGSEDNAGSIGLVAVDAACQGHGIGQMLVDHALEWFAQHKVQSVNVVTQGHNIAAQRLYQRCGSLTRSTGLWYHIWFS